LAEDLEIPLGLLQVGVKVFQFLGMMRFHKNRTGELRMKSEFPVNKKAGVPRSERTAEQRQTVETMAGYGISHEEIDAKTLRVAFREELHTAATKVNAAVVKSLYKNAVQPNNVAAQIWWTKARMRWSETVIQKDQDDVELARMSDGTAVNTKSH